MKLFDATKIPILGKALGVYATRQQVISANIANINTVGYRSKAVLFADEMNGAMQAGAVRPVTTDPGHLSGLSAEDLGNGAQVVDAASAGLIPNDPLASGVNNVDIDQEMAEMAKNQIRFKFAARLLGGTFRDLDKSIKGQA